LDTSGFAVGDWVRSWSPGAYAAAVEEVRSAIARGDVYQVNLVQHLEAPFHGAIGSLATALAPCGPCTLGLSREKLDDRVGVA
jgi:anthranilate/para-aminobenzoate synthase component I